MTQEKEDAKVLKQLGLTSLEAKVFLALTKLGKVTIKTIGTTTKIDRANIYRVMASLEKHGLVEKMITKPTTFKAIDIHDAMKMLLEQKEKEYRRIEIRTAEIIEKYVSNNETENLSTDECQFALFPDNIATIRKIQEMIQNSKESYDFIFYWPSVMQETEEVSIVFNELKKKNINIRLIACMHEKNEINKNIIDLKNMKAELRYSFPHTPITLTIIDKKEAVFNTAPFPNGTPSLWSNNRILVSILQNYFDRKWNSSTKKAAIKNKKETQDKTDNIITA